MRDPIVLVLPVVLVIYAVVALAEHWWLSGLVAVVAAVLLWRRHPRARFTAYILLSALVLRGVFGHSWRAVAFALVVLALLQTPGARRAWPRLTPGARPGGTPPRRPSAEGNGPSAGARMGRP